MTIRSDLRRLALASAVALSVGLPLLACSGATTPTTDTPTTEPAPAPAPADPKTKLVGTWKLIPEEQKLRQLRIIDAALSGRAQKVEKLGDLTPDEQKLFDQWKDKKGDEVKDMKARLRFLRNCTFDFTDKQVTIRFGEDETYGPVDYTITNATDTNTTVTFDPGLGNGVETHSIDWQSDGKGVDNISAGATKFDPLTVVKK
jgi:hypothetical protein